MTRVLILSLLAATLIPAAHAEEMMTDYYTVTKVETHEVKPSQSPKANPSLAVNQPAPVAQLGDDLGISDISTIVNIGEQVWNIIQANKPVVNVTTNSASAMPQGVANWESLEDWQAPQTKTYETTFTNGFGMTVIDFQYQVNYLPGGSYDGKGQFLANITVVPQNVTVLWGYTFNAQVSIPSITNAGTTEAPVAAAEVLVQWTVDTVLKHEEQSADYYIRGDGEFEALQ